MSKPFLISILIIKKNIIFNFSSQTILDFKLKFKNKTVIISFKKKPKEMGLHCKNMICNIVYMFSNQTK